METKPALLETAVGAPTKKNEPLAPHTTFRIGGPADLFVQARTMAELVETVRRARQSAVPFFVLGNGSNILVGDRGVRGLVIENHCDRWSIESSPPDRAILTAESGASLPGLANRLARLGWSGLEWAIGVPSTIGGAVVGNAGANGGSLADRLVTVTVLDASGAIRQLPKKDCGFDYRQSRFKENKREIVLSASVELRQDDPAACIARMNEYAELRRRTQPTEPSVGSMFKNPPGDAAGRLIEQAGLKGVRIGSVEVSRVHANFFVNRGGATAGEVMALVQLVTSRVRERFGIELELEIEIVGEM